MGLGKTLQTIALIHTLHYCSRASTIVPSRTYLLLAPASVVHNWKAEFEMWLDKNISIPKSKRHVPVYLFGDTDEGRGKETKTGEPQKMSAKMGEPQKMSGIESKRNLLDKWRDTGGVFILSFESFRALLSEKKKTKNVQEKDKTVGELSFSVNEGLTIAEKKNLEDLSEKIRGQLYAALIQPGPDMVVVDEGQRIKDKESQIFKLISKMETRKRLVLTGYPLQNNLEEFWTMIEFTRPGYFSSAPDFRNRFILPIQNGQFSDSTSSDVRLMLQRLAVLNELVSGFVHRLGPDVLAQELPPKTEVVITFKLSEVQLKLYQQLLDFMIVKNLQKSNKSTVLEMANLAICIVNHPDIVREFLLEKFPQFATSPPIPKQLTSVPIKDLKEILEKNNVDTSTLNEEEIKSEAVKLGSPDTHPHWSWPLFLDSYEVGDISISGKFTVLKTILEESVNLGEKVLVFTQSIPTLNLIESLLFAKHFGWKHDRDYYRIDGTVSQPGRSARITAFNSPKNTTKAFLISTKAGGVGVNLVAATRVVSFDTCWNPCHDRQSIEVESLKVFRCYRYGQTRPVFVYSLVGGGVAEEVIYWRQIHKESLFKRVVERGTAKRTLRKDELDFLHRLNLEPAHTMELKKLQEKSQDPILSTVLAKHGGAIVKCHFHQELLADDATATLTESERQEGWQDYNNVAQQPLPKKTKTPLELSNKPSLPYHPPPKNPSITRSFATLPSLFANKTAPTSNSFPPNTTPQTHKNVKNTSSTNRINVPQQNIRLHHLGP